MNNGIILNNRVLDIVFVALVVAQVLKVIISLFVEKRINFRKFLDTGSMPSSHTASVCSLATATGLQEGVQSIYFAITIVFAIVVMYDATGVRRAVGKQAVVLNKIIENIHRKEGYSIIEENLKELLGHTPLEVFGGAVLGVLIALILY
ncbi:MAG: divergent PAP2 family protein [Candidatus Cloacimonetes bacterium]|nr:divergent PAP2 family protein [Candidatus Cloacimonadota bacterium]